jgi:hypothetical protein
MHRVLTNVIRVSIFKASKQQNHDDEQRIPEIRSKA